MDETVSPVEAEVEKLEHSQANENEGNEEKEITSVEENVLVTEEHLETEAKPTEFVEEAVTSPRKQESEEAQVSQSVTIAVIIVLAPYIQRA